MHLPLDVPSDGINMFLAHEDKKKLEFFEIHKILGPGAQMMFRCKWRKLDTLLFFFIVLVNRVR